jgi:hypothetical protein
VKAVNVCGQAVGFLALTPIKAGEEGPLRTYLEGLGRSADSPLARSARTHMARWVIVADFFNDPSFKQRKEEHLAVPWLAFSSNADGDLDGYLDELCAALSDVAGEIWGRCIGCPEPATGDALKAYLKHNQIDCGFFYAAYGAATVAKVKASLAQSEQLRAFATRAQGMAPADLQQAFVAEFGAAR